MDKLNKDFAAFRNGVESAPEGCYEYAREVRDEIGNAVDALIQKFRDLGIRIDNSDAAHNVEAVIFDWVRKAPPHGDLEGPIGLGRLSGAELERSVFGLKRDREFLNQWKTG